MLNLEAAARGVLQKKVLGLQLYLKKETQAQVFSCEICKISKNTFLENTSSRLLLSI